MRATFLAGAAALALSGCAEFTPETVIGATGDLLTFSAAAQARGVNLDGTITAEEAPGYLAAMWDVWGDDIPPEWAPVAVQVCALAAIVQTDLDDEAEAVCAAVTEG